MADRPASSVMSRRSRLLPTNGTLKTLNGGATRSFTAVGGLLRERAVPVPERTSDTRGWGQYLDSDHRSDTQWGRYGTSAAVRALAIEQRQVGDHRSVLATVPVNSLHPDLLPDAMPAAGVGDELKGGDFARVMKLAYILEGVVPDEIEVPAHRQEPQLIELLWGLSSGDEPGWSTRDATYDSIRDRLLTTSVVLYALRRFPVAQRRPEAVEAYAWVADQVNRENFAVQNDLLALIGLALAQAQQRVTGQDNVKQALSRCDESLTIWARRQKRPTVDRPYFNGFAEYDAANDSTSTDYIFLSPELLAARYFLVRSKDGKVASTRRFVLRTVGALIDNIDQATSGNVGGHRVQDSMIRTVDQAWALDLLEGFATTYTEDPKRLLPATAGELTTPRVLFGVWLALVVALLTVVIVTAQPAVAILSVFAGVIFSLFLRSLART